VCLSPPHPLPPPTHLDPFRSQGRIKSASHKNAIPVGIENNAALRRVFKNYCKYALGQGRQYSDQIVGINAQQFHRWGPGGPGVVARRCWGVEGMDIHVQGWWRGWGGRVPSGRAHGTGLKQV
jgi:hypothetical protein